MWNSASRGVLIYIKWLIRVNQLDINVATRLNSWFLLMIYCFHDSPIICISMACIKFTDGALLNTFTRIEIHLFNFWLMVAVMLKATGSFQFLHFQFIAMISLQLNFVSANWSRIGWQLNFRSFIQITDVNHRQIIGILRPMCWVSVQHSFENLV